MWEDVEDRIKQEQLWTQFKRHMGPKLNQRRAKYHLQELKYKNEELIDVIPTRCPNLASKCRFREKAKSEISGN